MMSFITGSNLTVRGLILLCTILTRIQAAIYFERSIPIGYKETDALSTTLPKNFAVEISFVDPCSTIGRVPNFSSLKNQTIVNSCTNLFQQNIGKVLTEIGKERLNRLTPKPREKRFIVGFIVGVVVTNMVESIIDRVFDSSSVSSLDAELIKTQKAVAQLVEHANAERLINKALGENMKTMAELLRNLQKKVDSLEATMLSLIAYYNYLGAKIVQRAERLEQLLYGFRHNRIDLMALNGLMDSEWPRNIDDKSTKLLDMKLLTGVGWPTLRVEFSGRLINKEVRIIEVVGVKHLINFARTITEVEYGGPEWAIFNTTNNCVKAVFSLHNGHVDETCLEADHFDSRLSTWNHVRTIPSLKDYNATTYVVEAYPITLVNCFKETLTIDNQSSPCPHYVFSLPSSKSWTTGSFTHEGLTSTTTKLDYEVPALHYGTNDSLASINETEFIYKIDELNHLLDETELPVFKVKLPMKKHDAISTLFTACVILILLLIMRCIVIPVYVASRTRQY